MNNLICRCGHNEEMHTYKPSYKPWGGSSCFSIIEQRRHGYESCHCLGYRLDNLKYLEKIYEEKLCQ